jgi:hypothetical protein
MRKLTPTLFDELKKEKGKFHALLEYVKADDTLDMEFRGNSFTLYYRGGAILTIEENEYENTDGTKEYKYNWKGINKKYLLTSKLKHNAEDFEEYIPEAKHIMDRYICIGPKNHLGEKEIQQLVVKENNYSQNSQDTDYFIVDMEYTEGGGKDGYRFDLIAVRWDSYGPARRKHEVSLAIIEVKQGFNSVRTSSSSPGLRSHQEDFSNFIDEKKSSGALKEFREDMVMIFKQKCELGLILPQKIKHKIKNITQKFELNVEDNVDFICLLANYKKASDELHNELDEMESKGMKSCKFIRSHYCGYGLYADEMFTLTSKDL